MKKKKKMNKLIRFVRGSEKHLLFVEKRRKSLDRADRRRLDSYNKKPLTEEQLKT